MNTVMTFEQYAAHVKTTPQTVARWHREGVALPDGARIDAAPGRKPRVIVPVRDVARQDGAESGAKDGEA